MSDKVMPVVLAKLENGELWFLKEGRGGLEKHRKLTYMIDGEIISESSELVKDEQETTEESDKDS